MLKGLTRRERRRVWYAVQGYGLAALIIAAYAYNRGSKTPPRTSLEGASFPWMRLSTAERAKKFAAKRGVSKVARSPRGFMTQYARAGSASKLPPKWKRNRNNFVKRHMAQVRKNDEALWKGDEPTDRHLALAMWAYTPDSDRFRHWLDRAERR